jgi:WD40 repeat protein
MIKALNWRDKESLSSLQTTRARLLDGLGIGSSSTSPSRASSRASSSSRAATPETPSRPHSAVARGPSRAHRISPSMELDRVKNGLFSLAREVLAARGPPLAAEPEIRAGSLTAMVQAPMSKRGARIFTSSTFDDTRAWRNALMTEAYPVLMELATTLDLEWSTVDMRWGVREGTIDDHTTTELCLAEVNHCLRNSLGVAFVVFLGQRYGFRPFPNRIPQAEFEALRARSPARAAALLDRYFALNTNWLKPQYILRNVSSIHPDFVSPDRERQKAASALWWADFAEMQGALRAAALAAYPREEDRPVRDRYLNSVTHNEICAGCLNNPQAREQAVVFARTITALPADDPVFGTKDVDAQPRVRELREQLTSLGLVREVSIPYEDMVRGEASAAYGEHLRALVCDFTDVVGKRLISAFAAARHDIPDDVKEWVVHAKASAEKTVHFTRHDCAELHELVDLCLSGLGIENGATQRPIVLFSKSGGSGKTSMLSAAVMEIERQGTISAPGLAIVLRFAGLTTLSSSSAGLMGSLARQIMGIYREEAEALGFTDPEAVACDAALFNVAVNALPTAAKPLVIVLDSLNDLPDGEEGRALLWLPKAWTNVNLRVVLSLSVSEGGPCGELVSRPGIVHAVEIQPVSALEIEMTLKKWLTDAGSRLQPHQFQHVLERCLENPSALYIRLAFDFALRWHSFMPAEATVLASSTTGLVEDLFERVERRQGHLLISRALSYIHLSGPAGVTRGELEDILSCDDEVLDSIFEWWVPPQRRMPVAIWGRIEQRLAAFLTMRGGIDAVVYNFDYKAFEDVVFDRYLAGRPEVVAGHHAHLARYFGGQFDGGVPYKGSLHDRSVRPHPPGNPRRLRAEVFHQLRGGLLPAEAHRTLANLKHLDTKVQLGLSEQLRSEASAVLERAGGADQSSDFEEFAHVCRWILRDVHKAEIPGSCWAQLALDEEESNPAVREMLRRQRPEDLSRLLFPYVVGDGGNPTNPPRHRGRKEACEMTLTGHTAWVTCVATWEVPKRPAPLIVSAGNDRMVNVFNSRTGNCVVNALGHTKKILSVAAAGALCVTGGADCTARVWSLAGEQLRLLDGHSDPVTAVALVDAAGPERADSLVIVTGCSGGLVMAWSGSSTASADARKTLLASARLSEGVSAMCSLRAGGGGGGGSMVAVGTARGRICTLSLSYEQRALTVDAPELLSPASLSAEGANEEDRAGTRISSLCCVAGFLFAGSGEAVAQYELASRQLVRHFYCLDTSVLGVAVTADLGWLAVVGVEPTMRVWNLKAGEQEPRLFPTRHAMSVTGVSAVGLNRFATASYDKTVKIFDVRVDPLGSSGHLFDLHSGGDGYVTDLAVAGSVVASCSSTGSVTLHDAARGTPTGVVCSAPTWLNAVALDASGKMVVAGGRDRSLYVFNAETGALLREHRNLHTEPISCVCVHGSAYAATASYDCTLKIVSLIDEAEDESVVSPIADIEIFTGSWCTALCLFPDGRTAITGGEDCALTTWDLTTGRQGKVKKMTGHTQRITALAVSSTRTIVSGSRDNQVRLWTASGRCLVVLRGHTDWVTGVSVTPHELGLLICTASDDKTVRVWAVPDQLDDKDKGADDDLLVATLHSHTNAVSAVVITSSGVIVSGGWDGEVKFRTEEKR